MRPPMTGAVQIIPGHPIAGTEQSGPEAGFPTLFRDAWHILTPRAGHRTRPMPWPVSSA